MPINLDQKQKYLNTGNLLSNVDERSFEESKMGQSSMIGEQDFGFNFGRGGLSDSIGNSQGSASPKFSRATPMPVRALQSPMAGSMRNNTMRIPQTGMISRDKKLDEIAPPSRKDRFMKKTFEIKH